MRRIAKLKTVIPVPKLEVIGHFCLFSFFNTRKSILSSISITIKAYAKYLSILCSISITIKACAKDLYKISLIHAKGFLYYKLIQLFKVTCFIAGQYNTGYYGTFTDVI